VLPGERTFPVVTPADVSDAVSSWGRYKGKASFETFRSNLTALCKRKGAEFTAALPKKWREEKAATKQTEMSLRDIENEIYGALSEEMARPNTRDWYICETYLDHAIVKLDEDEHFSVPFTLGENGEIELAPRLEWIAVHKEWVPNEPAESAAMAMKVGARHSAKDAEYVQGIHDHAVALGASCKANPAAEKDEEKGKSAPSHAVKSLGGDKVGAYAVIYGTEDTPDLSDMKDFFTKATDFWLDKIGPTRPMIYHHAQEPATAAAPVVGAWTKAMQDDVGVWLEGELDKAHKYREAIKEMIAKGVLALSSDSAPHLVTRKKAAKGTHEVTRWPLLAASLTPTPAEPRLLPVDTIKAAYKAIGIAYPDSADAATAPASEPVKVPGQSGKSAEVQSERESILLDLLALSEA